MEVPRPGCDVIWPSPPIAFIRSRMLKSPNPEAAAVTVPSTR